MMIAQHLERYDDMAEYALQLGSLKKNLTAEERNLFALSFKNVVNPLKSDWDVLQALLDNQTRKGKDTTQLVEYLKKVKGEVLQESDKVIHLVSGTLLKYAEDDKSRAFYLKMLGDYNRYKALVTKGEERLGFNEAAKKSYGEAIQAARDLIDTNPIKLGIFLNYSIFYYENEEDPNTAIAIAEKTLKKAEEGLKEYDDGDEETRDVQSIIEILSNNLSAWTAGDDTEVF